MSDTDPKDPLIRSLVTLGLIPRHPRSISTQEMHAALKNRGFDISLRTLQRDLTDKLSLRFPLIRNDDERGVRWSFDSNAQVNLPATDTPSALAMHLAEGHLRHLLPPSVLGMLEPQFATARNHLQSLQHNALGRWAQRVRSLPTGKPLLPAAIDGGVWEQVASALLEQRQLSVDYLSRMKDETSTLRLHPKALASRGPVTYLIATVNTYDDTRHFALHRIQKAQMLVDRVDDGNFSLESYLTTAAFTPRNGAQPVKLVAEIHPQIAWTLRETPLSRSQTIEPIDGTDWMRLTADVTDDQETLWWILGLGDKACIKAPDKLREATIERISKMNALYLPH